MKKRLKYSVVSGLIFGISVSIYTQTKFNKTDLTIVLGVFCFVFFSIISFFKLFANITDAKFVYQLKGNKAILYSSRANHYIGRLSVGGKLYLLNDKIIFQTNLINFTSKHEVCIYLNEITAIRFETTYGLFDMDFIIETVNGNERFMSKRREIWKERIEKNNNKLIQPESKSV